MAILATVKKYALPVIGGIAGVGVLYYVITKLSAPSAASSDAVSSGTSSPDVYYGPLESVLSAYSVGGGGTDTSTTTTPTNNVADLIAAILGTTDVSGGSPQVATADGGSAATTTADATATDTTQSILANYQTALDNLALVITPPPASVIDQPVSPQVAVVAPTPEPAPVVAPVVAPAPVAVAAPPPAPAAAQAVQEIFTPGFGASLPAPTVVSTPATVAANAPASSSYNDVYTSMVNSGMPSGLAQLAASKVAASSAPAPAAATPAPAPATATPAPAPAPAQRTGIFGSVRRSLVV